MTIGIVTIFNVGNYGALLQTYGLTEYLKRLGHDVFLFDVPLNKPSLPARIKRRFLTNKTLSFIPKYLPYVEKDLSRRADLYLVGSDQVWNPDITGIRWADYFLAFAPKNSYKAAYAASFGTQQWMHPDKAQQVAQLLRDFKKITVRENSGVALLRDTFNLNADNVLDPCFLLDASDYQNRFITPNKNKGKHPFIASFKLCNSPQWQHGVKKYASKLGMKHIELNDRRINIFPSMRGINSKSLRVGQWLQTIYDADLVITDSFHGTVFSILFNKQFVAVPGVKGRETRLKHLLSLFGLSDRYFDSLESIPTTLPEINFSEVNERIKEERYKSQKFIAEILASR